MKKVVSIVLTIIMTLALCIPVTSSVKAAGSLSISASKTTVNVGDSVTVTVSISSGYGASGVVSRSSDCLDGSADKPFSIGDVAGQPTSMSFTFKATSEGSCTVSVSPNDIADSEGNPTDLGGNRSVTINVTSASNGGNTGGSTGGNDNSDNSDKSSDNTLSSLVISNGTLSPEFSSKTKNYTTIVDYSVTSLAISATPADANAKVASVSGNENLEVGENTVSIVVKAENGASTTYTIVVTRRSADDPENADAHLENPIEYNNDGTLWTAVNVIDVENIPAGFEQSTVMINNQEVNCLKATFGDLILINMKNADGTAFQYFIYDVQQNTIYDYVVISSESHFIIPLLPDVNDIPEGYTEVTLNIEGKGTVTAYQDTSAYDPEAPDNNKGETYGLLDYLNIFKTETVNAAEANVKDFYYIYALNDHGEKVWYEYDSVDGTYIRYIIDTTEGDAVDASSDGSFSLLDIFDPDNKVLLGTVAGVFVFILILLIIILILGRKLKKARKQNESQENELEFIEEEYEEENDIPEDEESFDEESKNEDNEKEESSKNDEQMKTDADRDELPCENDSSESGGGENSDSPEEKKNAGSPEEVPEETIDLEKQIEAYMEEADAKAEEDDKELTMEDIEALASKVESLKEPKRSGDFEFIDL